MKIMVLTVVFNVVFITILLCSEPTTCQIINDPSLFPPITTVYQKQFQLLLVSSISGTYNCSVKTASSESVASAIAVDVNPCSNYMDSANWIVVPSSVMGGSLINVVFNSTVIASVKETIAVTCCNSINAASVSSAVTIISVDLQPNIAVNTNFTPPASATIFDNPAYVNIAPCPCDLHVGSCDVDCCCDTDCTTSDLATFQCLSGFFGGNFTVDDVALCNSTSFEKPDWHAFTCLQFLNSPDLGLFYANVTGRQYKVQLRSSFNQLEQDFSKTPFSLHDASLAVQSQQPTSTYNNGDPVRVVTSGAPAKTGYLTLPQNSLSGQCVRNSIVRFQNNSFAFCDVTVSNVTCSSASILDVDYYLNNLTTVVSSTSNVTLNVAYFRDSPSKFVKAQSTASQSQAVSLFASATASTGSSARSTSKPGVPVVSGGSCNNTVVNVSYTMTWIGANITRVDAVITVADVPLTDSVTIGTGTFPNNVLSQSFSVIWTYSGSAANSTQRSGNPGYEIGFPVISGTQSGGPVNTSLANQLRVWKPGPSGLCADSGSVAPAFGQDSASGCLLRLSLLEFENCSALRALVEENQRALVTSNRVSRFGNPNLANYLADEWIILDSSGLTDSTAVSNLTVGGQCPDIPSQLAIDFITSVTGRIENYPIMEIVGARVRWIRETWSFSCGGSNACRNASFVESFPVTSLVTFTSLPATPSAQSQECAADATCWPHLLHPLTLDFYSTQPISIARRDLEYNIAWTLVLVFFCLGAALLSVDWSRYTSIH